MAIYLGSTNLTNFKMGSTAISKVYWGSNLIYPTGTPPTPGGPPVTSGLLVYLDADNYTVGSSTWANQAPTGATYNATMFSPSSTKKGTKTIIFNGTSNYATLATKPLKTYYTGDSYPFTLLVTAKVPSGINTKPLANQNDGGDLGYSMGIDSNERLYTNGSLGNIAYKSGASSTQVLLYGMLGTFKSNGVHVGYLDGTKGTSNTFYSPATGAFPTFQIGKALSWYFKGSIGSVYFYDRILTDVELEQIRQYELGLGRS